MSYIGNQVTSVPHVVDVYTGDGINSTFGPLTRAPAGTAAIAVFISGSYRIPGTEYFLNGDYITFTSVPGVGAPITIHHLGNGTTTQVPSDGSVTGTKLAINSVRGNNIVAGEITGNLIGSGAVTSNHIVVGSITGNLISNRAVSGNNIVDNAIRSNNIVAGQITGNLIGTGSISSNQIVVGSITGNLIPNGAVSGNNIVDNSIRSNNIVTGQITGNLIGTYAVSGNQIGIGAISANNFAGGGITSNVLASNLTISTVRVAETVNVVTSGVSGNYDIHVGNTTAYYFVANTNGSVTFNLIANDATATGTTGTLNDLLRVGQTASLAIALKQGSTRYRANVFIDGVNPLSSVFWMGASQPAQLAAQAQSIDAYNITVIKIAPSSYTIMVSNTTYGYANGQGMGPGGVQ